MPYKLRDIRCAHCGVVFRKRANPSGQHLCLTCSIERATDSAMQLHRKSGPYWDRWRAGMRAALDLEDVKATADDMPSDRALRPARITQ